ncbi:hypothetical protein [Sphingomonas sp.]|jgi:hypothetical protein|uniref:hypothetical protein n=1 Tax=Sphingomonas sp. TaxID=28214 RepID=UPI002E37D2FD|nr:hypothetical protein [Sphingomonas sp.]HEX4694429.1 hypothetical protein [Sphingomonas sp.]
MSKPDIFGARMGEWMLRTGLFVLSATIAALAAGSADAKLPVGDASQCELHIWPTETFSGIPYKVGIITGRASEDQIVGSMESLVGPSAQLAALRDADPVRALGLPAGTRVVEHQEVLDRKTVTKMPTRRASSTSPCYSELIVLQHFLVEDIVWGDRFGSAFMFRNFGDKPEVRGSIKGVGGYKLKVLTMPEAARPANTTELVAAALKGNFLEFAKNVHSQLTAGSAR